MSRQDDPDWAFTKAIEEQFAGRTEPATIEDIASLYRVIVTLQQNFMDVAQVAIAGRNFSKDDIDILLDRYHENIDMIGRSLAALSERMKIDE